MSLDVELRGTHIQLQLKVTTNRVKYFSIYLKGSVPTVEAHCKQLSRDYISRKDGQHFISLFGGK